MRWCSGNALRARRAAAGGCLLALAVTLLGGCENKGFHDAELDAVKKEIRAEYARRDLRVTDIVLSRDSAYQASGVVTFERETPMGIRSHASSCSATMDRETRKTSWQCQKLD